MNKKDSRYQQYAFIITLIITIFSSKGENYNEVFNSFHGGKIVTSKGKCGVYNTLQDNTIKYGMCIYDEAYEPKYSVESKTYRPASETVTLNINSKIYSILPPIYDNILPISDKVASVCINKKWAYIDDQCNYLTPFVFDAALPSENGVFKVMLEGSVHSLTIEDLQSKYSTEETSFLTDVATVSLVERLAEEGQYDQCLLLAKKYISNNKPNNIVDLNPTQYQHLFRVQQTASDVRNRAMTTTVHPDIEQKFPGSYAFYRGLSLDINNSFLKNSPQIVHAITCLVFNQIKSTYPHLYPNLMDIEAEIDESEYKKAVIKYEALSENLHPEDKNLTNLLYICLLHLAGDFEGYNSQIQELALSKFPDESDPVLIIVSEALSNRFKNAIDQIGLAKRFRMSDYDRFLICAIEGMIYQFLGLNKQSLNSYKHAIKISSSIQKQINSPVIDVLAAASLEAYKTDDSELRDILNKYIIEECNHDALLFSKLNTLRLSKEWGFSRHRINSIINDFAATDNNICVEAAFKLSLFEKSLLLDQQLDWNQLAYTSCDPYIKDLFDHYLKLRSAYKGVDIYAIEEAYSDDFLEMMGIETKIKSSLYSSIPSLEERYFGNVTERLTSSIDDKSIIIDFFQYSKDNERILGAWIINSTSKQPDFIEIAGFDRISSYNSSDKESINESYIENGNLIWSNLAIEGYSTIFFSPSSNLDNMGVEFFQYQGKPLCVSFDTHRMSSILKIPETVDVKQKFGHAALFGGLDYGNGFSSTTRGTKRSGFLKWSLEEVNEIEHLLGNALSIKKYTGREGTPTAFRELRDISPEIIHFATHGYQKGNRIMEYFRQWNRFNYYNQNSDLEDEDWLLSSTGLYLSEDQNIPDSISNIILSREIALCRLNNTALFVLSACNTSYGSVSSGYDYIIGLNFALQKARVQNIITSVWDVYDIYTYQFMTTMYRKLAHNSISDAFLSTVREVWAENKSNPKIWSSFILIQN